MFPTIALPKFHFRYDRALLIGFLILLPIHFALAKLATVFTFPDGSAAIWPSSGVFLATLLLFGRRYWIVLLLCDFIINRLLFFNTPASFVVASLNAIDPLIITTLVARFITLHYPFNRAQDAISFIASIIPFTPFTALVGAVTQCMVGISNWGNFRLVWLGWYISTNVSMLIIAPALLALFQHLRTRQQFKGTLIAEFVLVLAVLFGIGYAAFWNSSPIEYMMVLPLLWAAFRLQQWQTTFLIIVMTSIAIVGTSKGFGTFAKDSAGTSLLLLQSFISALTIATLILSAATQENRISASQLEQANSELENRVEQRTTELKQTLQELQIMQAQLIQKEKMSSLGQLVAGVAHEINNPVNFIHGNLVHVEKYTQNLLTFLELQQQYNSQPPPEVLIAAEDFDLEFVQEDLPKILSSMKSGTERIRQIVLSLRNFSRMDEAEFKAVDIHAGIDSTLMILQHRLKATAERPEIEIIKNYSTLPLVECYAGQLNQVFMNILVNAIDAIEDSNTKKRKDECNRIVISTDIVNIKWVEVAIFDNGVGMSSHIQQRIFDPFFTTKPIGKGTGMGMSICYQIITENHEGKLICHSTPDVGTKFIIQIPLQQQTHSFV
ncbi:MULTISPECIES: MASE1 domain-containing protein [unclassified Nostoc]|uniref:MASE1 domain-containing protein n=1 Tax=unclassified Nostoc TaxID=2593658 RepID=UPI002AD4249A|nr:MASE1 domain-containing protein [Nostoc sp. DedQUE03]MDZ7977182.1 MASE1 domain-containing protein [Nostoc sp. DedQUE03]MDZ8044037.1 MASE1 domain-containing protein [Nostoc sp. DedQUE02]